VRATNRNFDTDLTVGVELMPGSRSLFPFSFRTGPSRRRFECRLLALSDVMLH
jgi:hypothetical protein